MTPIAAGTSARVYHCVNIPTGLAGNENRREERKEKKEEEELDIVS